MKKNNFLLLTVLFIFITSFSEKEKADLLVYHCTIYTVDAAFSTAEAMVIKNGKILAAGKRADLENKYDAKEKLDAGGKFIYPGL